MGQIYTTILHLIKTKWTTFLRCNIEWLIIKKEKRIIYVKNIETTLFNFLISAKSLKINLFLKKNMTFTFGCCIILKNVYLKKSQ